MEHCCRNIPFDPELSRSLDTIIVALDAALPPGIRAILRARKLLLERGVPACYGVFKASECATTVVSCYNKTIKTVDGAMLGTSAVVIEPAKEVR